MPRRWAVLLAFAACGSPVASEVTPPPAWVYPPSLAAWPLGVATGQLGRSQPPQLVLRQGVTGSAAAPLRLPTVWQVPGDGPPRAIVYGSVGGTQAIELIEIDTGRVAWRDTTTCVAPIVGVTDETVVCADARGTRAVSLAEGKKRWSTDGAAFIAMTGERIVVAGEGEAVVVDATLGDELARVKLPTPVLSESILASCGDAGRELFAHGQDGKLVRIAEGKGGPAIMWSVPLDAIADIDACDGTTVLVTTTTGTLVSLARDSGKLMGTLNEVRGVWPARDGAGLEVATIAGVSRWSRELVGPSEHVAPAVLGELIAKRGELRLVRATPLTAVVLDRAGVRAYVPFAQLGAAIGERSIVAASWQGSPSETVHRIAIPERYARALRVSIPRPGVAVPAELRDLPALVDVEAASAVAKTDAAQHAVGAVVLDPLDTQALYIAAIDKAPDEATQHTLARFDLRTRAWTWTRPDGCGAGTPVGIAVARDMIVCAARAKSSTVRATTSDGTARWEWSGDGVDRVAAAGDIVLVYEADRMRVHAARDGRVLAAFASDDGAAMRAVPLAIAEMTLLVTAERDRVVARVPAAQMMPAWSLQIAGVVESLEVAGDGVLVALEDGDAYRIDGRTGTVVSVPGLDLAWRATGELITGEAPGGPIPHDPPWTPPPPPKLPPRRGPEPERSPDDPPELVKPWPAPPPMRASWQYTLYELTGAPRARNDFALPDPITPAAVRAPAAPLVVQSGPGLREVLVVDPERGDPQRRVRLPDVAAPGMAFSTIVDGKPVVGTLLANPLRVVLF